MAEKESMNDAIVSFQCLDNFSIDIPPILCTGPQGSQLFDRDSLTDLDPSRLAYKLKGY